MHLLGHHPYTLCLDTGLSKSSCIDCSQHVPVLMYKRLCPTAQQKTICVFADVTRRFPLFASCLSLQVLDARSRQSIPNTMRWFNTVLSHPNVLEFAGPLRAPPVTPSASSSAISHAQTNGILTGNSKDSQSQKAHKPDGAAVGQQSSAPKEQQSSTGERQHSQSKANSEGQQDKRKGKDAKGGKLAKNDVAKGQKKGGDKKEKLSQAPKGDESNDNMTQLAYASVGDLSPLIPELLVPM